MAPKLDPSMHHGGLAELPHTVEGDICSGHLDILGGPGGVGVREGVDRKDPLLAQAALGVLKVAVASALGLPVAWGVG